MRTIDPRRFGTVAFLSFVAACGSDEGTRGDLAADTIAPETFADTSVPETFADLPPTETVEDSTTDVTLATCAAEDDGRACVTGTCIGRQCISAPTVLGLAPACLPSSGGTVRVRVDWLWDPSAIITIGRSGEAGVATTFTRYSGSEIDVVVPAHAGDVGPLELRIGNAYGAATVVSLALFPPFVLARHALTTSVPPSGLVAGDLDGDGHADLAWVANDALHVARGFDAAGAPAQVDVFDSVSFGGSLHIGDVDGDGRADVVAYAGSHIHVVLGVAGAAPVLGPTSDLGFEDVAGLALGDVDGDGDLDLAVGRSSIDGITIYVNDGDASFSARGSVPFASTSVAIGDLDGDGRADLVSWTFQPGTLDVARSTGTGFATPSSLPVAAINFVTLADFDGDGDDDVLLTSGDSEVSVRVYPSEPSGLGAPFQVSGGGHIGAGSGDFNGDGQRDIVTSGGIGLRLYSGNGDGTFSCGYEEPMSEQPRSWAVGDLDGDGDLDFVGGHLGSPTLTVFMSTPEAR